MARSLLFRAAMKSAALLVAILGPLLLVAHAQDIDAPEGAVIESAEVRGLSRDQLSPGLRQDIDALAGERVDRVRLDALAARIEGERPETIAAVRRIAQADGRAKVVFLVVRIDESDFASNINARYIVESAEITGVPQSDVSRQLRDDVQALVGRRLDPDEADRLEDRLQKELPGHDVRRHTSRGSERGRLRVTFEVIKEEPPAWIPFIASRSKFLYHGTEGWTGVLDVPIGSRFTRLTLGAVMDNGDDLLEEYSGYRFRIESRKLGTDRVGASFEFSHFHPTWRDATLFALASDPRIPRAYDTRLTVEPSLTFALAPELRVTGGISISDLEPLASPGSSQMANAGLVVVSGEKDWQHSSSTAQGLEASYELRAATEALEGDLVYTRHLARVRYNFQHRSSVIIAGLNLGGLSGVAPLFERFSLGDTSTLRGWNKYDVAPAGGDRMFHSSVEYRYGPSHKWSFDSRPLGGAALFFDVGSVWDHDGARRIRFSTGFGLHMKNVFLTLGFPLDAGGAGPTFMMGVRF